MTSSLAAMPLLLADLPGSCCLALTHWHSAASNTHRIQPFYDRSPLLSNKAVQNFTKQRRNLASWYLGGTSMCGLQGSWLARQEIEKSGYLWDGSFILLAAVCHGGGQPLHRGELCILRLHAVTCRQRIPIRP